MLVEIKFPKRCSTADKKRDFISELVEWGKENLNDQEDWKHKSLLVSSTRRLITTKTKYISFEIGNEEDAVALKLMWCET